jgi:hypothetical protein
MSQPTLSAGLAGRGTEQACRARAAHVLASCLVKTAAYFCERAKPERNGQRGAVPQGLTPRFSA